MIAGTKIRCSRRLMIDPKVADTLVMVLNFSGYDAVAAYSGDS